MHLSTDADSSTNTKIVLLVRQNLQKKTFLRVKILHSNLRPLISITFQKGRQKS